MISVAIYRNTAGQKGDVIHQPDDQAEAEKWAWQELMRGACPYLPSSLLQLSEDV